MAKIMLDAGHGGYDNGASFNGRLEKDDALRLTLAVGEILEEKGVDVLYIRMDDRYISPGRRAVIANEEDVDYFVSVHRNSGAIPNQYEGVQTLVYENEGVPRQLAERINENLEEVGFTNIGIEERKELAVLRGTDMPAVLLEVGFINSDRDNELLDTEFDRIAMGIADAIIDVTGTEIQMLSVETGVFQHYENAKLLAESMEEDGFSSFIVPQSQYYSVCHGKFSDYGEAENAKGKVFDAGYEARIIGRG